MGSRNHDRPIGVFDSGVGGLTVVREIFRQLPGESVLYLGDTARVPYGPRGTATITRFALELLQFLLDRKVKALVVACNSISAAAIGAIRRLSPVPVLDVIQPTVRAAVGASASGRIGVIGTVVTVNSGVYARLANDLRRDCRVEAHACPLFVPIVEEGLSDHPVAEMMAREYVGHFMRGEVDVLILGCTHYPLLKGTLSRVLGREVRLIDSAEPTVSELAALLRSRGLLREPDGLPEHRFCVTDASYKFLQIANSMMGTDLSSFVEQVSVELPPGEHTPAATSVAPLLAGA